MALGDQNDISGKLRSLIPGGWFSFLAPIRDIVLYGLASSLNFIYNLLQVVSLQTRIATSQGWFLDLTAWDFFGVRFLRRTNETDASFLPRLQAELVRSRNTRASLIQALFDLTGIKPQIFDPASPDDCGAIGIGTIAIAGGSFAGAGCIGSTNLALQVFVIAHRPPGQGVPNIPGIGYAGLGDGSLQIIDNASLQSTVPDSEIYATVANTLATGITGWTQIQN